MEIAKQKIDAAQMTAAPQVLDGLMRAKQASLIAYELALAAYREAETKSQKDLDDKITTFSQLINENNLQLADSDYVNMIPAQWEAHQFKYPREKGSEKYCYFEVFSYEGTYEFAYGSASISEILDKAVDAWSFILCTATSTLPIDEKRIQELARNGHFHKIYARFAGQYRELSLPLLIDCLIITRCLYQLLQQAAETPKPSSAELAGASDLPPPSRIPRLELLRKTVVEMHADYLEKTRAHSAAINEVNERNSLKAYVELRKKVEENPLSYFITPEPTAGWTCTLAPRAFAAPAAPVYEYFEVYGYYEHYGKVTLNHGFMSLPELFNRFSDTTCRIHKIYISKPIGSYALAEFHLKDIQQFQKIVQQASA